jgi:hypothetical protein
LNKWNFSETELRNRFIDALEAQNILIYLEVPVFSRSVDLVLQDLKTTHITAIELKLHDWKRAILQVKDVGLCFDYLYICLPKPKTPTCCQNIIKTCEIGGIGLYFYNVEANVFEKVVDSPRTTTIWEMQKKRVVDYLNAKRM